MTPEEQAAAAAAEEQNAAAAAAGGTPPAAEPEVPANEFIEHVEAQLEILKANGLEGSDDYKVIEAELKQLKETTSKQPAASPAAPAAEKPKEGEEKPKDEPVPGSIEATMSMLFGKITQPDGKEVEFKELKDVNSFLSTQLGLDDIKADDPGSIMSIADRAKAWKGDSEIKYELEGRLKSIEDDLSQLPDPVFKAMQAWAKGEDWKAPLASVTSSIDLTADPDSIDRAVLLGHYFPGEFDAEALKEGGAMVDKAVRLAKNQFAVDKKSFNSERSSILAAAENDRKRVSSSVQASVQTLKKDFPALDDKYVRQVEDMLKKGNINSMFFGEDGSYKPDAAKRIALALVGEQEINGLLSALKKRNEGLQQIVANGKTEIPRPGAQPNPVATAESEEIAKEAARYFNKSPYESRPVPQT
jgi:hypothetical protein